MRTCTNPPWSVSTMTPPMHGGDGSTLNVHRTIDGKAMDGENDGRWFPTSEAAFDFALAHGHLQLFYARPNGFIDLKLSPATRRYLRSKTEAEVWKLLPRILNEVNRPGKYLYDVRVKDYMADTRKRWMDSIYQIGGRQHPSRYSKTTGPKTR